MEKKLKLDFDNLKVETFETTATRTGVPRGTVFGHSGEETYNISEDPTGNPACPTCCFDSDVVCSTSSETCNCPSAEGTCNLSQDPTNEPGCPTCCFDSDYVCSTEFSECTLFETCGGGAAC